jgi:P63C domain
MEEDRSGKAKGGHARAEILTPEERSEIARKAATTRWSDQLPKAITEAELKIGDLSIPCAVLEDGTRMLTQWGFYRAIGRSGRPAGGWGSDFEKMAPFLALNNLKPFVSDELAASTKPVAFRNTRGAKAWGYRAELLPRVCEVYLKAREESALLESQLKFAKTCEILMRGLAHVGIIALIDEVTGYQELRPKDALQMYLERIIRKELAAWAKKFPDEFYENIYKLKGWRWPGMKKNRYSVVAHYTRDLVYERIAPGLLRELENKSPKKDNGNRTNKFHQWLTDDIGNPMLSQHLHSLLMFQRLAITSGFGWNKFVKMVDQVMPKRGATFELPFPEGTSSPPLLPE